jgi:ParB/RepB/Spo0J family partition protein
MRPAPEDRGRGVPSKSPDQPAPATGAELHQIRVDCIVRTHHRVRRALGDVTALAESIQDYGLLHPISVRADTGRFVLTAGERRLEAVQLLGWRTIPAFVRSLDADHAYVVELIENLQRENLSGEEEADALIELVRTRGWSLEQVATALKRSVAYVSKRVRVFEDPLLREAVVQGGLPVSTAEEVLAAEPELRPALVASALEHRWDQTTARQAVQAALAPPPPLEPPQQSAPGPVRRPAPGFRNENGSTRPARFTQIVREFHRLIIEVRAEDLTDADRGALRALFQDLVLLARAPAEPRPPIFPPLPDLSLRRRSVPRRAARGAPPGAY